MTNSTSDDERELQIAFQDGEKEDLPQWFLDQDDEHIQAPRWGPDNELIQTFTAAKFKFELQVFYQKAGSASSRDINADKDRIKMIVSMPDKMWFSIGFGTSMKNTDMIVWHADGDESRVVDYWSTQKFTPEIDEQQDLDFYFNTFEADEEVEDDYNKVSFLTYRDLDTGDDDKDYLISLEKEIHDMVYGIYLYRADFYEHTSRGYWKMEFNDQLGNQLDELDLGPGVIQPTKIDPNGKRTPFEKLTCQQDEFGAGFALSTCFDQAVGEMVFKVELKNNAWLSIGFGATMSNTDMIAWFVNEGQGEV